MGCGQPRERIYEINQTRQNQRNYIISNKIFLDEKEQRKTINENYNFEFDEIKENFYNNDKCLICQEDIIKTPKWIIKCLTCKNSLYHLSCIDEWWENKKKIVLYVDIII